MIITFDPLTMPTPDAGHFVATYRDWQLTITDHSATATTADGERFECYRQASAEDALRTSRKKVDRLKGPEEWDQDYEDEALR